MEEHIGGKLVIAAVTQDMMSSLGITCDELEGLAPITLQLAGTEVGILMREREPGEFKWSFRSADEVNVSEICQTLGGGGHAKAADCAIKGSCESVKTQLIEAVRKALS